MLSVTIIFTFLIIIIIIIIISECILSYELSRTSRLDVANGVRVNSSLALEVLMKFISS